MLNKKITAYLLAAAMLPTVNAFSNDENNMVFIDLSVDSDMFLKPASNVTKSYVDQLYYYNGQVITDGIIDFSDISYKLHTADNAMDSRKNDVIKIESEDVEIEMNNSSAKYVGFVLFTRDEHDGRSVQIKVNYANGETEIHEVNIADMFDSENAVSLAAPLEAIKKSAISYKAETVEGEEVYLNSCVADLSSSVNKSAAVKSITLPGADFTYYVAAVTQVNFTEEELEEATRQIIRDLYTKYADVNFIQVAEGENELKLSEAEELKQSLISQRGKMAEATDENIEKISLLIEGAKLYSSLTQSKEEIDELEEKYVGISSDFETLEQTDLTEADYLQIKKLIALYDELTLLDTVRLNEIADYYEITVDTDVDLSNKEKIEKLCTSYEKALLRENLKTEIEQYYDMYISKDISEITTEDMKNLEVILECLESAKENGIEFDEYDYYYINHLYSDYEKNKNSEKGYAIDISNLYNADSIANAGDRADKNTWYESADNISGAKILNHSHTNVVSYDSESGIITVKEFEYTENPSSTASPYKFTATGYNIPFVMPANGLYGSGLDTLHIGANSEKSYTVNLENVYTDKLYFMMSGQETEIDVKVLYNDGTEEKNVLKINTTAQLVDKVKTKVYENLTGYITSGDYANYNLGTDGIIYRNDGNVTNGLGIFVVEPDSQKGVTSVTFSPATKNTAIYGISLKPESNDNVLTYTENLYNEIVTESGTDISDKTKIAAFVMAYNECCRRGLYSSVIDRDILDELSGMVLTATGKVYRESKEYAVAEIKFSVPVDEKTAQNALKITADGQIKENCSVSFDEESRIMYVRIPVGKEAVNSLSVELEPTVTIDKYPNITMMYPLAVNTLLKEYITAQYTDGEINIINNSTSAQDYFVYIQAADGEKVYSVATAEGTINPDSEENISVLLSDYPSDAVISAVVLDKNTLAPLNEITPVSVCDKATTEGASYEEPTFNLETNLLTISGFTASGKEAKAVTVTVASNDEFIACYSVRTNKDGYFSIDIPVDGQKTTAGELEIKIGGDDFTEYVVNTGVSFSDDNERKAFVNGVKNADSENETLALLLDAKQSLSLSFKPFDYILNDEALLKNLAQRIFDTRNEIEAVNDNDSSAVIGKKATAVQTLLKQQAVLVCIQKGEKSLFTDGNKLIYDDLMKYSSIDSDGVTLYKLFCEGTSEKGKSAVINAISTKTFKDDKQLLSQLKKEIMLNALIYPSTSGVGYVKNVITAENAKAVGISITKYLNLSDKSEASSHIANMKISSLDDVTDYIATLKSDNSGGGGSSGGGGGSSHSGGASLNPVANAFTNEEVQVKEEGLFTDLPSSHWGYGKVKALYEKGIVNGYGDGSFGTDKVITRAEFVKLVCLIKGIKAEEVTNVFTDVDKNDWYAPYVSAAYKAGLVNGISDTEFGANLPVSRQDICVILYRSDNIKSDYIPQFADVSDIADYALEAVGYFSNGGIINGYEDNTFKPTENASRVQAAAVIYNYMNK